MRYDVAIIGAGASGMVSAISLAKEGLSVVLIEKQERGGKKILASGNGKCNITNIKITPKDYFIQNRELISSLTSNCSHENIENFFKTLGVEFEYKEDGKAYPKSYRASIVLELLEFEIKRLNIDLFYNIKELKVENGFMIKFNNKELASNYIIIATGSQAAPQLGGTSDGSTIAKSFGHNIIKELPALTQLESNANICKILSGIKLKALVKLYIDNKEKSSVVGDLLFSKYGLTGLTVLDLSFEAVKALDEKKKVEFVVDFFPYINKNSLLDEFKTRISKKRELPLRLWLGAIIDSKFANFIVKELNLENKKESSLNTKTLKELIFKLKNYKINIDNYREFKYAEVAMGGVDSKELTQYFESTKVKNLYFVGEVTDCVGKRGGYNFSYAWCSAFKASSNILKKINTNG